MMGRVMVVTSGKGGTGKTLFTANMGALLAMQGKKVLLMDMDMGLRNLDLYLGLESRVVYNVMDVLSGMCRIQQALVKDKRFKELYLMAASPNKDQRDITSVHMEVLIEKVRNDFDYILIDAPAGIGEGFYLASCVADQGIIITEPEFASLRDADTVDRELQHMGIENRCCVVNKVKGDLMAMGAIPGISSISEEIRMDIVGLIQYDNNVFIATNRGVPIVIKPNTYIEKNFRKIMMRILER